MRLPPEAWKQGLAPQAEDQPRFYEERHPHPDGGQPEIHVYADEDASGFEVWLNTGVADHDGLCIGTGDTRQAAVQDAANHLEWALEQLNGPPPAR